MAADSASITPAPLCSHTDSSSEELCSPHYDDTQQITCLCHNLHVAEQFVQRQMYLVKGSSCWLYKTGSPTQNHTFLGVYGSTAAAESEHASSRTHPTALYNMVAEETVRPCQIKNEVILLLKVAFIGLSLQIMWSNEKMNFLKGINKEATVFFFFFFFSE